MKYTLTFNMDNASFEDDRTQAIADILRHVAFRIERDLAEHGIVIDVNGNRIGR